MLYLMNLAVANLFILQSAGHCVETPISPSIEGKATLRSMLDNLNFESALNLGKQLQPFLAAFVYNSFAAIAASLDRHGQQLVVVVHCWSCNIVVCYFCSSRRRRGRVVQLPLLLRGKVSVFNFFCLSIFCQPFARLLSPLLSAVRTQVSALLSLYSL